MPLSPAQAQHFTSVYQSIGPNGPDEQQRKLIGIVGKSDPGLLARLQQSGAAARTAAYQQSVGFDPMSDEDTTFGISDRAVEQGFRELPQALDKAIANPLDISDSPILSAASDLVPGANFFIDPYTTSAHEKSDDPSELYGLAEGVSRAVGAAVPVSAGLTALGATGLAVPVLAGAVAALPTTGVPGGVLTGNVSREDAGPAAGIVINAATGGLMSGVAKNAAIARLLKFQTAAKGAVDASKVPLSTAISDNASLLAKGITGELDAPAAAIESAQRILQATKGGGDAAAKELYSSLPEATRSVLKRALRDGNIAMAKEIISKDVGLSVAGVGLQAAAEGRTPTVEELGAAAALPFVFNAAEFHGMNKVDKAASEQTHFRIDDINKQRLNAKTEQDLKAVKARQDEALKAPLKPEATDTLFDHPTGLVPVDKVETLSQLENSFYNEIYPANDKAGNAARKKAQDANKQIVVEAINGAKEQIADSPKTTINVPITSAGVDGGSLRKRAMAIVSRAITHINSERSKGSQGFKDVYVTKVTLGPEQPSGERSVQIEVSNKGVKAAASEPVGADLLVKAAAEDITPDDGQLEIPFPKERKVAQTPENMGVVRADVQGPDLPPEVVTAQPDMFPTTERQLLDLDEQSKEVASRRAAEEQDQLRKDIEVAKAGKEVAAERALGSENNASEKENVAAFMAEQSRIRQEEAEAEAQRLTQEAVQPLINKVKEAPQEVITPEETATLRAEVTDKMADAHKFVRKVKTVEAKAIFLKNLHDQFTEAKAKLDADYQGVKERFTKLLSTRGKTAPEANKLRAAFRAASDSYAKRVQSLDKELSDAITLAYVHNAWLDDSASSTQASELVTKMFGKSVDASIRQNLKDVASTKGSLTRAEKNIDRWTENAKDKPLVNSKRAFTDAADSEASTAESDAYQRYLAKIEAAAYQAKEAGYSESEVKARTDAMHRASSDFRPLEMQSPALASDITTEYDRKLALDVLESAANEDTAYGSVKILDAIERERVAKNISDKQAQIITNLVNRLASVMDGLGVRFSSSLQGKGLYSPVDDLISVSRKLDKGDLYNAIHEFIHPIAKFLPPKLRQEVLHAYNADLVKTIDQYKSLLNEATDPHAKHRLETKIKVLEEFHKNPTIPQGRLKPGFEDIYRFSNPDEWFVHNVSKHEIDAFGDYNLDTMMGRALAYTKMYLRDFWEFAKSLYGGEDKARKIWKDSRDAANLLPSQDNILSASLFESPELFDRWVRGMHAAGEDTTGAELKRLVNDAQKTYREASMAELAAQDAPKSPYRLELEKKYKEDFKALYREAREEAKGEAREDRADFIEEYVEEHLEDILLGEEYSKYLEDDPVAKAQEVEDLALKSLREAVTKYNEYKKSNLDMQSPATVNAEIDALGKGTFETKEPAPKFKLSNALKSVGIKNGAMWLERQILGDYAPFRRDTAHIDVAHNPVPAIDMARAASSISRTSMMVSPITVDANGMPVPYNEAYPGQYTKSMSEIVEDANAVSPGMMEKAVPMFIGSRRLLERQDVGRLSTADRSALERNIQELPEIIARNNNLDVDEVRGHFESLTQDWAKHKRVALDFMHKAGLLGDGYEQYMDDIYFRLQKLDEAAPLKDIHKAIYDGQVRPTKVPIDRMKEGLGPYNLSIEPSLAQQGKMIRASLENIARRKTVQAMESLGTARRITHKAKKSQGSHLVDYFENGRKVLYEIDDPIVYDVLSKLGPEESNWFIRAMGIPKRILSAGVVLTPDYLERAFIREGINNFLVTGGQETGIGTYAKTVGELVPKYLKDHYKAIRENPELLRLAAAGVLGGGNYDIIPSSMSEIISGKTSAESLSKDLLGYGKRKSMTPAGALSLVADWMHAVGSAEEAASFLQQYRGGKAEGLGEAGSIETARKLLNRSLTPASKAVRLARALIPFMQPRLAGLDALSQSAQAAFGGKGYHVTPKQAERIRSRVISMAVVTMALGMFNRTTNKEDFNKLEDWQNRTYWPVPTGGVGGHDFIMLPKPFEIGAVLANLADIITGLFVGDASGDVPDAVGQYVQGVKQALEVNPTPQAIAPLLEDYANKSGFTGRPIVTSAQAQLAPAEQYGAGTSETAKAVAHGAGALGLGHLPYIGDAITSPVRAEHLARGYLGTASKYILGLTDMMLDPFIEGESPNQGGLAGLAYRGLVQPIAAESDPRTTKSVTQMYDLVQEVRELNNTYVNFKETGRPEKAAEYKKDNASMIAIAGKSFSVNKRVARINEAMKKVREDVKLSGQQKQDILKELNNRKNNIAREFLMSVKESSNAK